MRCIADTFLPPIAFDRSGNVPMYRHVVQLDTESHSGRSNATRSFANLDFTP